MTTVRYDDPTVVRYDDPRITYDGQVWALPVPACHAGRAWLPTHRGAPAAARLAFTAAHVTHRGAASAATHHGHASTAVHTGRSDLCA